MVYEPVIPSAGRPRLLVDKQASHGYWALVFDPSEDLLAWSVLVERARKRTLQGKQFSPDVPAAAAQPQLPPQATQPSQAQLPQGGSSVIASEGNKWCRICAHAAFCPQHPKDGSRKAGGGTKSGGNAKPAAALAPRGGAADKGKAPMAASARTAPAAAAPSALDRAAGERIGLITGAYSEDPPGFVFLAFFEEVAEDGELRGPAGKGKAVAANLPRGRTVSSYQRNDLVRNDGHPLAATPY